MGRQGTEDKTMPYSSAVEARMQKLRIKDFGYLSVKHCFGFTHGLTNIYFSILLDHLCMRHCMCVCVNEKAGVDCSLFSPSGVL